MNGPAFVVVGAAVALALTGCSGGPAVRVAHPDPSAITVASFDFPESEVLAQLYAQALRAAGYPARLVPNLGSRELMEPALAQGFVTVVPEYTGSALDFVSLGAGRADADPGATREALASALDSWGALALASAPAQDANAIVVTQATAFAYGLRTISDLAAAAPRLVFGGPPECPQRPYCLKGLEAVYGLHFERFQPLDTGGPLTMEALVSGGIDVALLFTTDPQITAKHLVVLKDDRRLQPAENVTPVVGRKMLARFGPGVADVIDRVSAQLTTAELRALVGRVTLLGQPVSDVAARWLRGQGLVAA